MKCRIAIIDYKTCNINSVIRAFQNANAEVVVVSNLSDFKNIDKIVIPVWDRLVQHLDILKNKT